MAKKITYSEVYSPDDIPRFLESEEIKSNGDTIQRVHTTPASWTNAGLSKQYYESTFTRPKDWPTTGRDRYVITPQGYFTDNPLWINVKDRQQSFDDLWSRYKAYRKTAKNPKEVLPPVEAYQEPSGPITRTKPTGFDIQATPAPPDKISTQVYDDKVAADKKLYDDKQQTKADSISKGGDALINTAGTLINAFTNFNSGNNKKAAEANAIKAKNAANTVLTPIMDFNNSAKSSAWGNQSSTTAAPSFQRGGSTNDMDPAEEVQIDLNDADEKFLRGVDRLNSILRRRR